ncbi:hypothetical protein JST97_03970 [bacterium]|nr:hypothetical protein [bacterium]
MGYNASVTANCWKVHTCVNCSTIFRYFMTRKCTSQGGTADQARANLSKAVVDALTNGVDHHGCPTCGMVQPEMVSAARVGRYGCLNALVMVFAFALMITLGVEFPIPTVVFWGGLVLAGLAAAFVMTALKNPNTDVASHLAAAQKEVQEQKLFVEEAPELAPPRRSNLADLTSGRHPLAVGLLCGGLFLMGLPMLMKMACGWRENAKFFPGVVGPGDSPTYYFDRKISSIKGYWRAESIEAQLEGKKINASAKDNRWGDSISVKSSEKDDQETIWLKLSIPDEASLAKKEARLDLKVKFVAPVMSGSSNFREEEGEVAESPMLLLSSPGSGALYGKLAWLGVLGGSGLVLLAGYLLVRQAKSLKGNPHQALQAED